MVKAKYVPDISEHISYYELEKRIQQIEGHENIGHFRTEINPLNSKIEKFNMYKIVQGKGIPVLISGGVHGYEVSGVHSIIEFFKKYSKEYTDKFQITAFPCVNPWGFDKMIHENWQYQNDTKMGLNLNREFKEESEGVEINIIKPHLKNYEIHLDLHETWSTYTDDRDKEINDLSPDEFFLWETCLDKNKRFGNKIIDAVKKNNIKVCTWPTIYSDINIGGVISYPEGCGTECYAKGTSFDAYTNGKHTPQSFTIETPLFENLEYRVKANIITIETSLNELLKR
ncbi:MAG TPA: succinylglutamate desuccinylase/aspartoacylase family protein [Allocoleopsis sp.]